MDILKFISECIWDFLSGMYAEVIFLLLRWALLLSFLCISGMMVKELYRRGLKDTLIIQILFAIISTSIGISVSLDFIHRVPENLRNIIILISIAAWILLPYPVSKLIIRSFGYQIIARRILYLAEALIFVIQIITCILVRL